PRRTVLSFPEAPPHRPRRHSFPTRRSSDLRILVIRAAELRAKRRGIGVLRRQREDGRHLDPRGGEHAGDVDALSRGVLADRGHRDRKSTRLNSSHVKISYAVFCLKKKNCAE